MERIYTRCPSCGLQTLVIGLGGLLVCSWIQCKEPGLINDLTGLTGLSEAPVERLRAFAAISSERAYQNYRWNAETTTSEGLHSLEEWCVYLQDYLSQAMHQLSRNSKRVGDAMALDTIRKIAAMAVCAMEQHGAPRREGY